MSRPVKWSRDLHLIRERAIQSETATWSRQDVEHLFGIGRASAQSLMKSIGDVQTIGATHFVDRTSLLAFLDEMIAAPSVEAALRLRGERAAPVSRPAVLKQTLPDDLRHVLLADLPPSIVLSTGQLLISGRDAEEVIEGLLLLARVLQNDLSAARRVLDPPPDRSSQLDGELRTMLQGLRRSRHASPEASPEPSPSRKTGRPTRS